MDAIITLKVELLDVKPPVWRCLEVPAAYHLGELHAALISAMGWLDYHCTSSRSTIAVTACPTPTLLRRPTIRCRRSPSS